MRAVLVIACISVFGIISATETKTVQEKLAEVFAISAGQAEFCVNQTEVTHEDIKALEDKLNPTYNEQLLEEDNTLRAISTLVCAAQAQGTMQGAKLQMPKIHELVNGVSEMSISAKNRMHKLLDNCYTGVKDLTNENEVGLRFITCMIVRHPLHD